MIRFDFFWGIFRYITILYYLNDVEQGGETAFPMADNVTLDMDVSTQTLFVFQSKMGVAVFRVIIIDFSRIYQVFE